MTIDSVRSTGVIPLHIQESWKRCQSTGLHPTTIDKEIIIGEYELTEYNERYAELLYYSAPVLEDVYQYIRGTDTLLLIASPEGYIIDCLGDPSFMRHADHVSLRKGANWLEEFKGTNAIGTAIVEKKPVLVHGNQHFLHDNHFLTCAATPIYHPEGQLLGVLNVSSYHQNYHPHTLGLVRRVAHSIEQAIFLANSQKMTRKLSNDLDYIYYHHPSSLITIDKKGTITRINSEAARIIGCREETAVGLPITRFLPEIHTSKLADASEHKKYVCKNIVFTPRLLPSNHSDQAYLLLRGEPLKQLDTHGNRYDFSDILSADPQLDEVTSIAKRVAPLDMSILISGESGTGKELFAQSIHAASLRSDKPFIAINCSAIPDSLLESELFGYEKGAFTGAKSNGQIGKFEAADGGTLFLDEIGDMPLAAQAVLLRVLQEKCVTRIGGIIPRPVDVRIIAATHKDLTKEIEAGRFRADLYFRLNGFTLRLPALRHRSDLLMLADHIFAQLPFTKGKPVCTEDAKRFIQTYEWPGNFRQLYNVLQQAAFLAENKPITHSLLHTLCPTAPSSSPAKSQTQQEKMSIRDQEIALIKQALELHQGNITQAAKQLKIGRNTLYRKLKEYQL
ncbi:sigma-54-dependent Fis family transcriptional regulator [Brevibacillus sp. SYSU BS000544]|uniref:sigma-54-dependent Fis family transcriptional regulator n=1 Tax=Brevibacillus sp. SYSU BS000544 TaxID=3416443 RepID=UPI003CE478DF